MGIQKLDTQEAFDAKVNELNNASNDNNLWIKDNMECSTKSGRFFRFIKALFRIIGVDLFGHVRVNKVATNMLELAKNNKDYLNNNNAGLLLGVMSRLDNTTHGKYHTTVENMKLAVKGILNNDIADNVAPSFGPPPPPPPAGAFAQWENAQKGAWRGRQTTAGLNDQNNNQTTTTPVARRRLADANTQQLDIAEQARLRFEERQRRRAQANQDSTNTETQEQKQNDKVEQHDFRNVLKRTDSQFRIDSGTNQ